MRTTGPCWQGIENVPERLEVEQVNLEQFFASIKGKTVTFCGVGRSHMPVIQMFCEQGMPVSVRDKRPLEELGENGEILKKWGVSLLLGEDYLQNLRDRKSVV